MTTPTVGWKPGTSTSMTITNLSNLANSATAGWQSARIDIYGASSPRPTNVKFGIKLPMANTAPANDGRVYVYLCPWYYDGSTWYATDGGTTTLPSGTEGTYTIANPNDLVLLGALNYTTQNMTLQGEFDVLGSLPEIPDGVSLVIVNYSGAAIGASPVVMYKPTNYEIPSV